MQVIIEVACRNSGVFCSKCTEVIQLSYFIYLNLLKIIYIVYKLVYKKRDIQNMLTQKK